MQRNTLILLAALAAFSTLTACRARSRESERPDRAAVARGRQLFEENCAICHGPGGNGQGIRSASLDPRPPDFTNPEWQRAHPADGVTESIRDGVRGTAMPSWRVLGEQKIRDLAALVKSLSP